MGDKDLKHRAWVVCRFCALSLLFALVVYRIEMISNKVKRGIFLSGIFGDCGTERLFNEVGLFGLSMRRARTDGQGYR